MKVCGTCITKTSLYFHLKIVKNYLKAETPPWFWETCVEASLYAYRYTFPNTKWEDVRNEHIGIGLSLVISWHYQQTNKKSIASPQNGDKSSFQKSDINPHFSVAGVAPT